MTTKPFSLLAEVYDAIMSDVEYGAWAVFIMDLALETGVLGTGALETGVLETGARFETILDLGCGTGNSSEPFIRQGFDVTGIDLSAEMLRVARTKLPEATFVQADFTTFELEKRFDLAVSVFDSLNNLLEPGAFARCCERVYQHLRPGGLFIFDVNTTVGLRNLWEDDRAEGWVDDVYYLWRHTYDERTGLARVEAYCEKGSRGFTEVHFERPYDAPEVTAALQAAGFAQVRLLTYPEGYAPDADTERLWAVAQRAER